MKKLGQDNSIRKFRQALPPVFSRQCLLETDGLERLWERLAQSFKLTEAQLTSMKDFYQLLATECQKYNLIGYRTFPEALNNLFYDSLEVVKHVDFSAIKSVADVGTGAGFPALALKILMPEKTFYLIEVNKKKIDFLHKAIEILGLKNIQVLDVDWRTFCHKNTLSIDLFVSKAAFGQDELCRLFRQYSVCKTAKFVYWASGQWICTKDCQKYLLETIEYKISNKPRKFVIFGQETQEKLAQV